MSLDVERLDACLHDQLELEDALVEIESELDEKLTSWVLEFLSNPANEPGRKANLLRALKRVSGSLAMSSISAAVQTEDRSPAVLAAALDSLEYLVSAQEASPELLEDILSSIDRRVVVDDGETKDQFLKLLVACRRVEELTTLARQGDLEAIDALGTTPGGAAQDALEGLAKLGGPRGDAAVSAIRIRRRENLASIANAAIRDRAPLTLAEIRDLYDHEHFALLERLGKLDLIDDEQRNWLIGVLRVSPSNSQLKMRRKLVRLLFAQG